jgi:hypothetical protein
MSRLLSPMFHAPARVALGALLLGVAAHPAAAQTRDRLRFDRMIEVAPAPGRPSVGAVPIDWCAHANTEYASGGALARVLSDMQERGWHWEHVPKVAALLCANPGDPQYQRQAGYFIQGLVNLTGQPAAHVIADLRLRMDAARWTSEREQTCRRFDVSSEASAEQQAFAGAHRELFGCGREDVPAWWLARTSHELEHHLDRTADEPSQLQRAYHVMRCFSRTGSKPETEVFAYALCGHDARALDAKALDRELSRDKHNGYARAIAMQHLARVQLRVAEVEARVRALAKQDAAYEQLAFAVPQAAWQAATAKWRDHAEALARSAAYEARFYGPSKSAARNCATQLRDDFRAYVRGKKPNSLDDAKAAATDEVGVLLLARLTACEGLDGSAQAAEMLYKLGHEARAARGPRLAVLHALVDALGEIRADRERFPLEFRDLPDTRAMAIWSDAYGHAASRITATQDTAGVIKAVHKVGDGLRVEFATESWTEVERHCKDSNKIWKIDGGRVIYHQTCKKVGMQTVKRTPPTVWVPAAYADKLAKGAFVELDYDLRREHDTFIGMPRAVYKDKQRKQLVAAYGVGL